MITLWNILLNLVEVLYHYKENENKIESHIIIDQFSIVDILWQVVILWKKIRGGEEHDLLTETEKWLVKV